MSRKIVLAVLLLVCVLLVVLSFSLNAVIEKNRGRIQDDLERALGRAVRFSELKVSFWDGPGIVATELKVAEDPSFAATPFLQAKELRMRLSWLPLLIGRLRIERFVLEQPEIQIIKNETGMLNIAALAAREKKTPTADAAGEPVKQRKPPTAPRLVISDIHVRDGSLDYIDRTGREAIEVRVRRLDLSASGALNGPADVKVAAQLFNASGRNVDVEGKVGPLASRPWSQAPLDLKIRCDSLPLEPLIRAVPALRPYLFDYLQAGGPITFDSRLQGTIERPRFLGLNLTGAFFGAGATNTTLTGDVDLSRGEPREHSALKLKLTIDPLPLDQVKSFSFLQPLRTSLLLEGTMAVSADIEGSLDALKVRAAVKAGDGEVVYGSWFKKPKGLSADLILDLERQKDRILVRDSTLALNNAKIKFSGALEDVPERRLLLTVAGDDFAFANFEKLVLPLSGYNLGGSLSAHLALAKNFDAAGSPDVRGTVTLDKLQAKDRRSGRGIERATGQIVFRGREARIDRLLLRSGASDVAIAAVADLSQPALRYSLRAAKLKPSDFLSLPFSKGDEMKSVASTGDLVFKDGKPSLRAGVASAEGVLTELPYRNLRGDIFWTPSALGLKNVAFQTLSGNVRAGASWDTAAENSLRMALEPNIEAIELKTFLKRKLPGLEDHLDGRLSLKGKFRAAAKNISAMPQGLSGAGETQIRSGALKDFNLLRQVFARILGLRGSPRRWPPRLAALAERNDTPFETLTASFTIQDGRAYSKNLLLSAADYAIRGEASVGMDKTLRWDALLTLAPELAQELVREQPSIGSMVDRKGALTVPFQLGGTLAHAQVSAAPGKTDATAR